MNLEKKIATRASYGEALAALGEKDNRIVGAIRIKEREKVS